MIGKNNIFNIRHSINPWLGEAGTRKGFAEFSSMEYAVRAWYVCMRTYRRKYNLCTIAQIVNRFAPPSENDTAAYVRFVSARLQIKPDTILVSDSQYDQLADAMARMESGVHRDISFYRSVREYFNIIIVTRS